MRLPRCVLSLAAACLLGCDAGTVVAPGIGSASGEPDPMVGSTRFESEVLPLLESRCASCHVDKPSAPAFMAGPDVYETVMGWPGLVVPGDPGASAILTKGSHAGPAWRSSEERVVADWILAEGEAGPRPDAGAVVPGGGGVAPGDTVMTSPIPVDSGRHAIDLGEVGLPGAVLSFSANRVALGMHLGDIAITAGSIGVRVVHPRLVVWVAGAPVRDTDRWAGADFSVPAESTVSLATSLVLEEFPDPGALSVEFDSATRL